MSGNASWIPLFGASGPGASAPWWQVVKLQAQSLGGSEPLGGSPEGLALPGGLEASRSAQLPVFVLTQAALTEGETHVLFPHQMVEKGTGKSSSGLSSAVERTPTA